MGEILTINNVSKKYRRKQVLSNVDFSINKGEIVGLVGPNGAGKSTIMKIITGLIPKYDGSIILDNENIKYIKKCKSKRIGSLIETPGLYPNLTGYENLLFFSKISGLDDKSEIDEIVKLLGLESAIKMKVKKYSLGMKQRLGIAQAVLSYPPLLILDEPTNGLDPNVIISIRKFIKHIAKEKNCAVLISSHILSEIELMCDKVLFLQKGKILKTEILNGKSDTSNYVIIETESIDKIKEFLKEKKLNFLIKEENKVKLDLKEVKVQELLKELVKNEISFNGVYEEKETLEEKFSKTIGGSIDV